MSTPHITNPTLRKTALRASVAGGVGTIIEYYDFSIYAFLSLVLGPLFFPAADPAVSTIATLGVFASSYVIRPIGGIFFGWIGDKHGRKFTLVLTVVSMGFASAATAILPVHATAGIYATILLIIVRLAQGFAAGGEIGGAATYVAELAPVGKRGLYGSATAMGATMGFAAAALVVGIVRMAVPVEQFSVWGWRIPFVISLLLALISLWVRVKIEDSPQVKQLQSETQIERAPVLTVVRTHPGGVVRVAALSVSLNGTGYIGLTYFAIFLEQQGFDATGVSWISAICIALASFTFPFAGWLSDRFDRKAILLASYIIFIIIAWPTFAILATTSSFLVVGIVYLAFMFFSGWSQVPAWALGPELFPENVRYTGVSLGYNIGAVVAGGLSPLVAATLVQTTGAKTSPALWIVAVGVVGILNVSTLKKTAKRPLPSVLDGTSTTPVRNR